MSYFLAVDGGGTKTDVLCADENGQVLGQGLAGPTNLTATNVGAASFNLREGIRQATENLPEGWQVSNLVMGLAGMDTPHEAEVARQTFVQVLQHFPIKSFTLVNDIVIALASGTDKANALALISGTGSNCYGRNEAGHEAKVSGMDYLLTDQGSGYEIGRYVLRSAVKSFDGRVEKSILEELVCEHFKITSIAELKDAVYNPPLSKSEIANLSRLCQQALDKGDVIAQEIFDHVIDELFLMLSTVVGKLGLSDNAPDVVLAGSITTIPYIHDRLESKIMRLCPQTKLIRPELPPVHGALKMAMKAGEQDYSASPLAGG